MLIGKEFSYAKGFSLYAAEHQTFEASKVCKTGAIAQLIYTIDTTKNYK